MDRAKLKNCAFCGGKAEFKQGNTWTYPTLKIKCTKCGIQTENMLIGAGEYNKGKWRKTTYKIAFNQLLKVWN